MRREQAAFIRAICENPADDTPRLVFADWLDEHDQPERAMFIRIQVELAQSWTCLTPSVGATSPAHPGGLPCYECRHRNKRDCLPWCAACKRFDDLRYREKMFIQEYGWDKLDPEFAAFSDKICGNGRMLYGVEITRTRGFTSGVYCTCEWFLENAQRLFSLCPIEKVTLSDVYQGGAVVVGMPVWLLEVVYGEGRARDRSNEISVICVLHGRKLANLLAPAEISG